MSRFISFLVLRQSTRVCITVTCTVWGGSLLIATAGTCPGRFFLRECDEAVVQAVFQELCEHNHWERVLQEGSQAADAALVPSPHHCWGCPYSNVFKTPSSKGFCSFPSWRPEHLGGSLSRYVNRRDVRWRGMEQRTCVSRSSG